MAYWLMKSEPDVFSIENLRKKGIAPWDGVRNYQARNFLRAMKVRDQAFFYHSNTKPSAIVGMMGIVREAYPDPTQFDPRSEYFDAGASPANPHWCAVDVKFVKVFSRPLTLEDIRGIPALKGMVLLKRSRLSVQPVTCEEWETVLRFFV